LTAERLQGNEIVHARWLYQPFCDIFGLTFNVDLPEQQVVEIGEYLKSSPTLALIGDHAVGAGLGIFQGSTVTLAFGDKQRAMEAARLLGKTPTFREEDNSELDELRERDLALLDEILGDPEQRSSMAAELGLNPEDLDKEKYAERVFCP
jgi:hypothetical protein